MANEENNAQAAGIDVGTPAVPTVDWDDSEMRSTYANVVNASSTREEVTLFFGTNQTWNPRKDKQFHVHLTDRMVLNPHAAKRLWMLLGAILGEYESRFSKIDVEGGLAAAAKSAAGSNGKKAQAAAPAKAD
jgi:hypothetical protein